jgi:hypothetical protein
LARTPQQRQRTEQVERVAEGFTPVGDGFGTVGFPHGMMTVNGVQQVAVRIIEPISSNGMTRYSTVEWWHPTDGSKRLSCNCPGWTSKRGPTRGCKHTKEMEENQNLGMSPQQMTGTNAPVVPVTQTILRNNGELPGRGISLDD